jgi:hypothetical protein
MHDLAWKLLREIEGILQVQAKLAPIRKRLQSNMGSMYRSFDTGFCENIALYMAQVNAHLPHPVRWLCNEQVAMLHYMPQGGGHK